MMNFIDTHAHIYLEQFKDDISEIIERSQLSGLSKIFMPNIDSSTIEAMLKMEQCYPEIAIPMLGLHPCSVKADFEKELYIVEDWFSKRQFAGVGEIGMDLFWDSTFKSQQEEALRIQINLAKKYKVPIALHCRDSFDETISIVEELADDSLSGIFHCFTGNLKEAQRVLDLNTFYLGIGGVSTFKNGGMDKVLPHLNMDNIVLETDSPYLAPAPFRGKRNEPSYIPIIAKRVAELMNQNMDYVAEVSTKNALKVFAND